MFFIFVSSQWNIFHKCFKVNLLHHNDKARLMTHGVAMGDANGLYVEFEHVANQQDVGGTISL